MSELENAADRTSGPGPWFIAALPGACSCCGADIAEGDEIRADGWGRWEGRECCERARENEERAEREAAQRWGGTTFPDPAHFQAMPVPDGLGTPGDLYDYDGEG